MKHSKTFSRFKYAEEFAYARYCEGQRFSLSVNYGIVHYEPGEDEPYIYDDFIVEWDDG